MLDFAEKLLFEKFRGMPRWVRVLTYLVFLALYVYLLLVPRFVDGQLVAVDPKTGGFLPYRGVLLQLQVHGRDYKFKSNEGGYWSIPVVSKLPTDLAFQVYHEDLALWFPVTVGAKEIWTEGSQRIEISADKPFVSLKAEAAEDSIHRSLLAIADRWLGSLVSSSSATLILPQRRPASAAVSSPTSAPAAPPPIPAAGKPAAASPATAPGAPEPASKAAALPKPEASSTTSAVKPPVSKVEAVEKDLRDVLGKALGRPSETIDLKSPLNGPSAPTYLQRIQVITQLEKNYGFSIPDEHWRAMSTFNELVDYVHKRQLLIQANPKLATDPKLSWPVIQQSFPPDQRPVFRPNQ